VTPRRTPSERPWGSQLVRSSWPSTAGREERENGGGGSTRWAMVTLMLNMELLLLRGREGSTGVSSFPLPLPRARREMKERKREREEKPFLFSLLQPLSLFPAFPLSTPFLNFFLSPNCKNKKNTGKGSMKKKNVRFALTFKEKEQKKEKINSSWSDHTQSPP